MAVNPDAPTQPTPPTQPPGVNPADSVPPPGQGGGELPPDLPPQDVPDLPPPQEEYPEYGELNGGADQPEDPAQEALDKQREQQQALRRQGLEAARNQLDANIADVREAVEQRGEENKVKAEQRAEADLAQHEKGKEVQQEDKNKSDEAHATAQKKGKEFAALEQGKRNQSKTNQNDRVAKHQKAVVISLKKGKTTPEALLKRSEVKNQKVQQAFEKLPEGLRQSIRDLGKQSIMLQFLKSKLQMSKLQTWQRAAQAQGETQLAGQIQKAMAQLQKETPPVPAELSQADMDALESSTQEETQDIQESEDGSGEGESLGLSRDQRLATLEQNGQDAGGEGQGQQGYPQQGTPQQTAVVASNASAVRMLQTKQDRTFVRTAGNNQVERRQAERNAEQRGAYGILSQMLGGLHVLLAEDGERSAVARYAGEKHPLDPISMPPQRNQEGEEGTSAEHLKIASADTGGSGVRVQTANGRSLLPDQIFRAAGENPEAEFIEIAGLSVPRGEVERLAEFVGIRRNVDAQKSSINPEHMAFAVQHDSIPASVFA